VVGIDEGYTRYQIEDGVNGVLFQPGDLAQAVERASDIEWDPDKIRETARTYDVTAFRDGWRRFLEASD